MAESGASLNQPRGRVRPDGVSDSRAPARHARPAAPRDETDAVVWQDPPSRPPSRLAGVRAQLEARPGKWALIASEQGIGILPWWGPLHESDEFETRFVWKQPGVIFGPRDIYARKRPLPPATSEPSC